MPTIIIMCAHVHVHASVNDDVIAVISIMTLYYIDLVVAEKLQWPYRHS